jgi:uncharacterized OB-fold protein
LTAGAAAGPVRPLPALTELNRPYWTSGASGTLRIQRCNACERLIHPPALLCPDDHSDDLETVPVSGRARVETWTRNDHAWFPGFPAPYYLAYVALEEDARARVLTNLVNVDGAEVAIGMPVHVTFERHVADDGDEIHVPLFEPESDGT